MAARRLDFSVDVAKATEWASRLVPRLLSLQPRSLASRIARTPALAQPPAERRPLRRRVSSCRAGACAPLLADHPLGGRAHRLEDAADRRRAPLARGRMLTQRRRRLHFYCRRPSSTARRTTDPSTARARDLQRVIEAVVFYGVIASEEALGRASGTCVERGGRRRDATATSARGSGRGSSTRTGKAHSA